MVAQFYLSQEVAGKDTALARLNAQISRLSDLLSLERTGKTNLEDEIAQMRASLSAAESDRDRLRGAAESDRLRGRPKAPRKPTPARPRSGKLNSQLDVAKDATARAVAQIEILNQQISALRRQIGALESALGASAQKEKDSQLHIADLGQRLNVALAQRVQELSRYRSDFFGKLREILGNRPDIRVVGDRFVFQSESSSTVAPRCCGRKAAPSSTSSRARSSSSTDRFRRRSTGCCASTATPTSGLCPRLPVQVELGTPPPPAPSRSCNI